MFCEIKGIRIHYEIIGEGTPVVMLHGWGPDLRLMKGCMEPVFTGGHSGYMRIYPDLPGMGQSGKSDFITGSDALLEVILEFVDTVIPGKSFLLAGESYGGYLARGVIHRMRERVLGLLLICPVADPVTQRENCPPHIVLERDERLFSSLSPEDREFFDGPDTVQTERVWNAYKDDVLPGLKTADYDFLNSHLGKAVPFSFDVDSSANLFERPSLFVAGRQDCFVGYRDLWKVIENYPRASFVLLDKAGHNLQIEQDRLFRECVSEWLDRIIVHCA